MIKPDILGTQTSYIQSYGFTDSNNASFFEIPLTKFNLPNTYCIETAL